MAKKLGVVLSGGGIRGLAHVGVLQVLREADIEVHHYSGTSAGALVGVMAASGCSIDRMLDFWLDSHPFGRRHLAHFRDPGIYDPIKYVELLRQFVSQERFEELPTKLTVAATAMIEGRIHYFSEGPLWPVVIASAAFPLVFSPVHMGDEVFLDGGVVDNFPSAPLRADCDVVIGVNVSPRRHLTPESFKHPRQILDRIMDLCFGVDTQRDSVDCDHLVVPEHLEDINTFDTSKGLSIYESGVEAGRRALPQILELLN